MGPSPWEAQQLIYMVQCFPLLLQFSHESGTWGQQAKKELDLLHTCLSLLVFSGHGKAVKTHRCLHRIL